SERTGDLATVRRSEADLIFAVRPAVGGHVPCPDPRLARTRGGFGLERARLLLEVDVAADGDLAAGQRLGAGAGQAGLQVQRVARHQGLVGGDELGGPSLRHQVDGREAQEDVEAVRGLDRLAWIDPLGRPPEFEAVGATGHRREAEGWMIPWV